MARKHNTNREGNAWTQQQINAVWQKGSTITGFPSEKYRADKCSHAMEYSEHGNRQSQYGWEIDHINPVANGGGDELWNLQPLFWGNNADKSDKLNWVCPK